MLADHFWPDSPRCGRRVKFSRAGGRSSAALMARNAVTQGVIEAADDHGRGDGSPSAISRSSIHARLLRRRRSLRSRPGASLYKRATGSSAI